jgi:hypothetical protein
MGLENHGKRRYYYRKRRIGKRVVSEYVGAGDLAEFEHILNLREQAERRRARQALVKLRGQLADPPELVEYFALVRLLTDASLAAAGLRQHKRGEWRKPRE